MVRMRRNDREKVERRWREHGEKMERMRRNDREKVERRWREHGVKMERMRREGGMKDIPSPISLKICKTYF